MPHVRLVYYSENLLDVTAGGVLRGLSQILSVSNRNNRRYDVTGALVFDQQWFIQALEGEREAVWATFDRIRNDERHAGVVITEVVDIEQRVFGNWWMGLAARDEKTERVFDAFTQHGRLDPRKMKASAMLALMEALSQSGLHRELVAPTSSGPKAPLSSAEVSSSTA